MSFRNDGSCRIDDASVFENVRANPRLQSALRHEINAAPGKLFQFLNERFKLDQTDTYARLELHHDVDVALGRISPRTTDPNSDSSFTP